MAESLGCTASCSAKRRQPLNSVPKSSGNRIVVLGHRAQKIPIDQPLSEGPATAFFGLRVPTAQIIIDDYVNDAGLGWNGSGPAAKTR